MTLETPGPAQPDPAPGPPPAALVERGRFGPGAAIATLIGVVVTAACLLGAVWVLTNQQRIIDQFAVWQYEPSATIAGYADRADLTDDGRFLFFASRPEVQQEDEFDLICSTGNEGLGVLGCYLPEERRIYLYDVTDDRLDGLEEVVATHELLHAVWDRMSQQERDAIGPLLEAEAAELADDEAFAATMEFYAESEPGERLNELHSILGTEVADLSPALEAHYALYLGDRSAVVAMHDQSSAVFTEQQERAAALVAEIESLVAGIDADYATYSAGNATLNADIANFNARADAGDFSSQAQFDSERNALLARGADLDALYASIESRRQQYLGLVSDLDALNEEIDGLNASVNIAPPDTPDLSG